MLPGSPALDAGNPATPGSGGSACPATGQRGVLRPQFLYCDIGAFELDVDGEGAGGPDNCPGVTNPGQADSDGDGFLDGEDCVSIDGGIWQAPGASTVVYDTIATPFADDFTPIAAGCVESGDGTNTWSRHYGDPSPGQVLFFLVRANNACAEGDSGDFTSGPRSLVV